MFNNMTESCNGVLKPITIKLTFYSHFSCIKGPCFRQESENFSNLWRFASNGPKVFFLF